ncbi:MAG TPA: glycosyltransferase [Terriglobales bacterium]|nr:glycosyltransferase [Terriglobales bacterium]
MPRAARLHVLTLTPFYPSARDDAGGCFVAEPLALLAELGIKSTAIAARPFYRGGRLTANETAHPATWFRYIAPPRMTGLALSGRALYLRIRGAVQRLHSAEPLTLIHAHAALPCGQAAALLARDLGVPFVVTVHGRDVFSSRQGGFIGHWCELLCKNVYRSARCVICVSERVQEDLRSGLHCRSSVVRNGVDTKMFSPQNSRECDEVVLSVGNLIPSKGHEALLRSLAAIRGTHPRLRCEIIGTGPERARLAHLAQQLGISDCVVFLGWQSRAAVARAMQRCCLFVLPSSYEGLGCVYLEAMATGKPTVGCRRQGIAEVIKSGETGWLVEPGDTESLANVLHQLLRDSGLRERVGMAGRRVVLENFSVQHQAERLLQVYQECAQ